MRCRVVMAVCSLLVASGTAFPQDGFAPDRDGAEDARRHDDGASFGDEPEQIEPRAAPLDDEPDSALAGDAPASDVQSPAGDSMSNDDVLEMVRAEFGESTIKAAIDANDTAFDVTPKALVALKTAGVPESVIESMLAVEAEKKNARMPAAAAEEPAVAEPAEPVSAGDIALLSQAIERLATVPPPAPPPEPVEPVEPEPIEPKPISSAAASAPLAYVVAADDKSMLSPSVAQVAFTDSKTTGATALRTLENLSARKALVFASPALAVANEIGGLFRSDDPMTTAVWALPSAEAERALRPGTRLEVEFSGIPGVNPDHYQPALVQLVPTIDNFRLVAAARTKISDLDRGTPTEPIIEEAVGARIDRLERGRYRVVLYDNLAAGEYALVLRPAERRGKRRDGPTSLGELLGAGADKMLYVTWDFSIAREASPPRD